VKTVLEKLDALIGGVVAVLIACALVLATLGILSRYALSGFNLDWTGEVVVFIIIWAILLSLPRIERRSAHVRVDFLFNKMGNSGRLVSLSLAVAIGLCISALFVWSGWLVVSEAILWDERTPSTLRVPLWIYYLALSTGFALNTIFLIERVFALLRRDVSTHHESLSD